MPNYAQFVIGPAGCGKSTYCSTIQKFCQTINRTVRVINLDPDAECFDYEIFSDIRDLVAIEDLKESDVTLGPNGGLIYCMEYLWRNIKWLEEQLDIFDNDYFIFDCPGQIELYTHLDVMPNILEYLKEKLDFRICTVFVLDCHFLTDPNNYLSCSLTALGSTLNLACAHFNLMSKVDLLSKFNQRKMMEIDDQITSEMWDGPKLGKTKTYQVFLRRMAELMEDNCIGGFLPINKNKRNSILEVLMSIDLAIGYGEDLEPRYNEDI